MSEDNYALDFTQGTTPVKVLWDDTISPSSSNNVLTTIEKAGKPYKPRGRKPKSK